MSNSQPEARGDKFPDLEEIDPSELNIEEVDSIPLVEAATTQPRGFGFGKALLWCLLFVICTQLLPGLLVAGGFVAIVLAGWVDRDPIDVMPPVQVATVLAPIFGAVFSILILRRVVGKDWHRRIGLRMPNLEHVVLILIAFPAVQVLVLLIAPSIARSLPEPSGIKELMGGLSSWPWFLSMMAIAVGPGISEELWCRGFLGWGLSGRYGFPIGVALTSVLFGLIHVNPPQVVMATLLGSLLHLSYLATRSLWVPILLHFLNNWSQLLNDSTSLRVPFLSSLESSMSVEPLWFPISAGVLVIVVGVALYQYRIRLRLPNGINLLDTPVLIPTQMGVSLVPRPLHPLLVVGVVLSAALFGWFWLGLTL